MTLLTENMRVQCVILALRLRKEGCKFKASLNYAELEASLGCMVRLGLLHTPLKTKYACTDIMSSVYSWSLSIPGGSSMDLGILLALNT